MNNLKQLIQAEVTTYQDATYVVDKAAQFAFSQTMWDVLIKIDCFCAWLLIINISDRRIRKSLNFGSTNNVLGKNLCHQL